MDSGAQGGALTATNRCGCQGTSVFLNYRVVPPSCSCPSLDGLLCVNTLLAMMYVGLVRGRSFCGAPAALTTPSLVSTHVHLNERYERVVIMRDIDKEDEGERPGERRRKQSKSKCLFAASISARHQRLTEQSRQKRGARSTPQRK